MSLVLRVPAVVFAGLMAAGAPQLARASAESGRVVAVGGAVTEIVYALGAGARLVAVDSTSSWPEGARRLPKVGYVRTLSAEGVLSLKPGHVLAAGEAGPPPALAQIRAAGVGVTTLSAEHSFEALRRNVRAVAGALGAAREAELLDGKLLADWREAQAAAKRTARAGAKPRVLFILAHTGSPMVSGTGTAAAAMLDYAGATNAFSGVQGYKPMTAEAVVAAAPDVVLITREGLEAIGGADQLWTRAGLAQTPAGRAKRVIAMDALLLLGFGPRMPQAVRELAERLQAG